MKHPLRLARFALLAALALPTALFAGTVDYVLDTEASTVGFETDFGPDLITGTFPLETADLKLDFVNVANSTVSVALDVTGAEASFPFAAQALKGPKVLDAKEFPKMSFVSTAVRKVGDAAEVTGGITLRGVTKPITFKAELFRPAGSDPADHAHLTLRLTGHVLRSAFGATGWADMVGDEVRIVINAKVDAKG